MRGAEDAGDLATPVRLARFQLGPTVRLHGAGPARLRKGLRVFGVGSGWAARGNSRLIWPPCSVPRPAKTCETGSRIEFECGGVGKK